MNKGRSPLCISAIQGISCLLQQRFAVADCNKDLDISIHSCLYYESITVTIISRVQEDIFIYSFWHMLVVIIHQIPRDWSSLVVLLSRIRLRWGTAEHLEYLHGIMNLFLLCVGIVSLLSTKQRSTVSTGSIYSSKLQFTYWQSTFKNMFALRHFFLCLAPFVVTCLSCVPVCRTTP